VRREPAQTIAGVRVHGHDELFARTPDASGTLHTADIGPGVDCDLVGGGPDPVLLVSTNTGQRLLEYDAKTDAWRTLRSSSSEVIAYGATPDQVAYVAAVAAHSVSTVAPIGTASAPLGRSYPVPSLAPDPAVKAQIAASPAIQSLYARAGADEHAPPTITQLVPGLGNEMYALVADNFAAGVTDLSTGSFGALKGWSWVEGGCLGGDGSLYVVGSGPGKGASEAVMRVDPQSLAVGGAADLGWTEAPADQAPLLGRLWVMPTQDGVLVAAVENYSNDDPSASRGPMIVWAAGPNGARKLCQVPKATGIKIGFGEGGALLLFCGREKNAVVSLDPTTGAITRVPSMTAPVGSHVLVAAQ
jgi:hypothetical protein